MNVEILCYQKTCDQFSVFEQLKAKAKAFHIQDEDIIKID